MRTERSLLGHWLARLTLDPIDPNDPGEDRYVPLQEAGRGAVDKIFSLIDLAFDPTTQLLSGPSGSGKTTELNRLRGRLQDTGFTVILVDILAFVNQSSEIDPTEFLIALGLAGDEQLLDSQAEEQHRFATRFRDFLRRAKVSIGAGPVSASISAERVEASVPGLSLEVDLKRELKSSEPFVTELRRKLAFQLGTLYDEVAGFFQDLVRQNKERDPDSRGVVVIVDSLEKLRGTTENDERVQASVQGLFVHHSDKLRFRSHHTVYTCPPYLMFTDPGALAYNGAVRPVPIPYVRNRAGERDEKTRKVMAEMIEVVKRRIPWEQLLESEPLLEDVILASGGHLRDLFRILQEIVTLVYGQGLEPPVGREHVDEALAMVAHGFSNITRENAELMRRVFSQHGKIEPRADEVQRLARLMHTHMLLAHLNDDDWYEVHPLARRTLGLE